MKGDVDAINHDGLTPILLAVEKGDTQMVRMLHDEGASAEALRRDGVGFLAISIRRQDNNLW